MPRKPGLPVPDQDRAMAPGNQENSSPVRPDLRPPGALPTTGTHDTENLRWLWISLAAVMVVGLAVILVLPRFVGNPQLPQASPEPVSAAPDSVTGSADANQAMQAYLQLRAKLELENVTSWGEPEWSQAGKTASAAGSRCTMLNESRHCEMAPRSNVPPPSPSTRASSRDRRIPSVAARVRSPRRP